MVKAVKHLTFIVLLFLMVISGCSNPEIIPVEKSTSTVIQATIPEMNVTPSAALTPTEISEAPTPHPVTESSPTDVPTATREIIPVCSAKGIPVPSPDNFSLPGTLVLRNRSRQELLTIGGTPLEQNILPIPETHRIQDLDYSPDEEWLAYVPVMRESDFEKVPTVNKTMVISGTEIILETPSIVLLSATGEHIDRLLDIGSIEGDLVEGDYLQRIGAMSWINDHLLHVIFRTNNFDPYSSGHYLDEIFDPFQGVWLVEPFEKMKDRDPYGEVRFSPDMSRVLYDAATGGNPSGITLRDLDNDTVIWSDPEFYSPQQTLISWALNSSMVAVGNLGVSMRDNHIYLISRDGEAKEILDSSYPESDFIIEWLSWSPDGRTLVIKNGYGDIQNLYFYDTITNRYLYSCPLVSYSKSFPKWVWSPDSKYLAITSSSPSDQFPLQILDVGSEQVIDLLQDGNLEWYLEDWLATFPLEWP